MKNKRRSSSASLKSSRWTSQFRYAWENLLQECRRHPVAVIMTILVITISLMLPTMAYLVWKNSHSAAQEWYPTPNLTVYLNKSLTSVQEKQIVQQTQSTNNVESVIYLSRDDALHEFERWSGFNNALNLLDQNPLPAVMIITPKFSEHDALLTLKNQLERIHGIDDIRIDDGWFTKLMALTHLVATICIIISVLMIISVFLVIGNSVRLTIFARRNTINIMRLIGATDGFILRPFLYQGAFLGFVSSVLAVIFSQIFLLTINHQVSTVAKLLDSTFTLMGLSLDEAILLIVIATIIGWLSAFLTTSRHLTRLKPQ